MSDSLNSITLELIKISTKQAEELLLKTLEMSHDDNNTNDLVAKIASAMVAATVYTATVCQVIHGVLTHELDEQEKKESLRRMAGLVGMSLTSMIMSTTQNPEAH